MKKFLKDAEISRLFPEEQEGGLTKETHLVKKGKEKYVLSICKKTQAADFYEALSKRLEKYGFLPKLLKRQGKRLLYEYIPGRDVRRTDALKVAYPIGQIAARISATRFPCEEEIEFHDSFYQKLNYLVKKKLIDKQTAAQIQERYENLRRHVTLETKLELVDPCEDNFRLYKGKVYLVDIHAIKFDLKGRGFSKTFMKTFKTKTQRARFEQGYNSVSSMDFLTPDYLQFVYVYHLVKNIASKFQGKRNYASQLSRLHKLLEGKLK
jgi:hypothetical protein